REFRGGSVARWTGVSGLTVYNAVFARRHMSVQYSSPVIAIRDATHADAGSIAMFISQLGYATRESDMGARLARVHSDANYRTLVAEVDGLVTGMVGVGL